VKRDVETSCGEVRDQSAGDRCFKTSCTFGEHATQSVDSSMSWDSRHVVMCVCVSLPLLNDIRKLSRITADQIYMHWNILSAAGDKANIGHILKCAKCNNATCINTTLQCVVYLLSLFIVLSVFPSSRDADQRTSPFSPLRKFKPRCLFRRRMFPDTFYCIFEFRLKIN
jgi:hypothetical protein